MKKIVERLVSRFQEIEEMDYDEITANAKLVHDLERDVKAGITEFEILVDGAPDCESLLFIKASESLSSLKSLVRKITRLKRDCDFFDPEAELDMMFPNRHDDDFDEDSMSYDSVFGDD